MLKKTVLRMVPFFDILADPLRFMVRKSIFFRNIEDKV